MSGLEEKLKDISPNERRILQCLAIFWEPLTAHEFHKLLKVLELKTPEGKGYSAQYVSLLRNSFIHKGVLHNIKEFWGSGFEIADERLREFLMREAVREVWFREAVEVIQAEFGAEEFSRWSYSGERRKFRLLRDYRLSIYQRQFEKSVQIFQRIVESEITESAAEIVVQIFSNPFQKDFLEEFDQAFQADLIPALFDRAIKKSESARELWDFVDKHQLDEFPVIKGYKIEDLLFRGETVEAAKLIGEPDTLGKIISAGTIAFLEKDFEKSVKIYEEAVKLWRKIFSRKKGFPANWQLFFYGLALYKTDESKFHKFAEDYGSFALKNYPETTVHRAVSTVSYFLKNNDRLAGTAYSQIGSNDFAEKFLRIIVTAIVPGFKTPNYAATFARTAAESGYRWIEFEIANLLKIKSDADSSGHCDQLRTELNFEPVGNIIPKLEDWERALNTLEMIAHKSGAVTESKAKIDETRVAWQLDFESREIQPVEQKYSKKGWTDGRNIALKRLHERDVKNLSEQDAAVVKTSLKSFQSGYYYSGYEFEFDWQKAIETLVEHPFLFLKKNPSSSVRLNHAEPNLVIKQIGADLELSFDMKITDEGIIIQKETETRYKVVKISKNHVAVYDTLKQGKLRIPAAGREKLLKAIQPLTTKMAIQSDLEEHFENIPSVEAENRIHALITPLNEGFHLEFFVKPFGTIPPYFKPGKGIESVIADFEGVRTRAKRHLKTERKLLNEIEAVCPFLAEFESQNYEWELVDAEACLTAMSEMETPRKNGKLVIEWTKGQKLKLLGNIGFENLSMSVKGKNNWFEVSGEAKVNEDLVLSMQDLTKLLTAESKNFIELSDGQFIAITEKLRKYLQSLSSVLDDKNRLHNLRSGILEEFSGELENFKADKAWKEHLERLKNAQKFVPELPATFEAEFRPYQTDGYFWLSRLANWGVGACLADDMGLGKTLMALASLVERAEKGAALVVAPVSVCRNWVKEAMRFAPTLNFQIFGDGDRKAAVENLGKYDVLVTSYSLLQLEEELFTSRNFATIVLDEAQAIKNRNTKRSRTVMNLQGDFRLITTGTPIENHLGELWNLFNFTNPGLLGNHEFFNEKFALPIEKNKDENARKTLQKLIKPFTLRRRKNQVLDDLPAKTEIVLTVEMSAEERAFYEAIRREALEKIESTDGEAKDKRFRILAELTRLRLACCHPKLVNENIPLGSSKLELFGETLEELLENKHKALVFSQFVKHLKIVENYLQSKGISYHYLDGSTPAHIRQERIDAFQRGEGEIFLISLKAGGTGLNLTAADYVIHLDPWWNPAVEDQATDRVHRIGQQRPVTVYRLVTENTVEEKILKLHETKRDLADSLLDGTDSSGKLSADDLLALISES
ncbi:MAG: DEAD/DEAH box helicase [Pyrinomonadaceae bacterium]|nr:DEAD/DEAH box helicase [Pyrinomonadaceae bacterium]